MSTRVIGSHAFEGCDTLASFTMSNSENVYWIGESSFKNAFSLTILPLFTPTIIENYAFYGCSSLLKTPNLNEVSTIGDYAFSGCSLISTIKIRNAKYMGLNSLHGCSALTELEVPFVGTTIDSSEAFGVIFGETFYENSYAVVQKSKTYYIPNGLTTLTIGGTSINSNAINELSSIKNLVVSNSVKTIGEGAFKGFNSLESITLPFVGNKEDSSEHNLRTFGYIFGSVNGSSSNKTSNSNSTYQGYVHISFNTYYYDCFYIPSTLTSVSVTRQTKIPANAFYNCDCIKNISLPTSTTTIGEYAFYNCSSLLRLNSENDGEFNIPQAVSYVSSYTFYNCSSSTSVSLSDSVTLIGDYAFYGCSLVSKFNSSKECEVSIPKSCTQIGSNSFNGMGLITNLIIPDSAEAIGEGAFKGFNSLESITLPFVGNKEDSSEHNLRTFGYIFGSVNGSSSNKTSNSNSTYQGYVHISFNTYYYDCFYIPSTLTSVSVTRQTKIPANAFYNCDCIKNIHLVNCIDNIGNDAFYNCTAKVDYTINPSISGAWDGTLIATSYHEGAGTQSDPYQIFSAKEFVYFLKQINSGETYEGIYFKLTSNINLGGFSIDSTSLTEATMFKGTMDGNSHKVFNFSINTNDKEYNGLFGYMGGIIKNIGFETSMKITSSNKNDVYVGLIVGNLIGTLENVYVSGRLNSTSSRTSYIGGLVGINSGAILNSYSNVIINAVSSNLKCYAGGLVGYNNGSVTGSFAYGNVSAKGYAEAYSYASGLIAAEGTNSIVNSSFIYDGQVIRKFDTISK